METNFPQERKGFKNLPFWEIGLVEFGFVAILIILLIGILNYFNILSISDAFPKQFGWLPRQTTIISKPSTSSKFPAAYQFRPSPKPTIPVPDSIKTDLKNFTANLLLSSLIANYSAETSKIVSVDGFMHASISWGTQNGLAINALIDYDNKNLVTDKHLFIIAPYAQPALTPDSTSAIAKHYLTVIPLSPFSCTSFSTSGSKNVFCESFWQEKNGVKRGVDSSLDSIGKLITIIYCEYPVSSPDYAWKSCNPNFKDTGIK